MTNSSDPINNLSEAVHDDGLTDLDQYPANWHITTVEDGDSPLVMGRIPFSYLNQYVLISFQQHNDGVEWRMWHLAKPDEAIRSEVAKSVTGAIEQAKDTVSMLYGWGLEVREAAVAHELLRQVDPLVEDAAAQLDNWEYVDGFAEGYFSSKDSYDCLFCYDATAPRQQLRLEFSKQQAHLIAKLYEDRYEIEREVKNELFWEEHQIILTRFDLYRSRSLHPRIVEWAREAIPAFFNALSPRIAALVVEEAAANQAGRTLALQADLTKVEPVFIPKIEPLTTVDYYSTKVCGIKGMISFRGESPDLYGHMELKRLLTETLCIRWHRNKKTLLLEDRPVKVTCINEFEFDTWDVSFDFDIEPEVVNSNSTFAFARPHAREIEGPPWQRLGDDEVTFTVDLSRVPKDALVIVHFANIDPAWACKVMNGQVISVGPEARDATVENNTLTVAALYPHPQDLETEAWIKVDPDEAATETHND